MPDERTLLAASVVLSRNPGLSHGALAEWGRLGKVHREPQSVRYGRYLYDADEAARRMNRHWYDGEPADELRLKGQRLLWVDKLKEEPYRSIFQISVNSLYDWDKADTAGCFALDGSKPGLVTLWFKGRLARPRTYVPLNFLERYVKARSKAGSATVRPEIASRRVSLQEAVEMGFPLKFLRRHTNYKTPNGRGRRHGARYREPMPKPHPLLGRFIGSGVWRIDGQWRPWISLNDLEELKNAPAPDPEVWLDADGVRRRGGRPKQLSKYERRKPGRLGGEALRVEWFWRRIRGTTRMAKHWRSDQIGKLFTALPRPMEYVHREESTRPDGSRVVEEYVPMARGSVEAGVKRPGLYHRLDQPNAEWGGRMIRSRRIPVKLYRVPFAAPVFVSLEDCRAVRRFLSGDRAEAGPPRPAEAPAGMQAGGKGLSKMAKALAALADNPEWSDGQIAKAAGCSRTSLYRWPKFVKARELLFYGRQSMPTGRKDAETGEVEAWEDDADD